MDQRIFFLYFIHLVACPPKTINDVDFESLNDILIPYLCKGQGDWYLNVKKTNAVYMKLQFVISLMVIIRCGGALPIPYVYRTFLRPVITSYPRDRDCFKEGVIMYLVRVLCCREMAPNLYVTAQRGYAGCKSESVACLALRYASRPEIISQFYTLLFKTGICDSCPRKGIREVLSKKDIIPVMGHIPCISKIRHKRFYDMWSVLVILRRVSMLPVNDLILDDIAFDMKSLVFGGEGILYCSLMI